MQIDMNRRTAARSQRALQAGKVWQVAGLLLLAGAWLYPAAPARAGGGPENVILVVNRQSPESLTVANHYIRLRGIPAGNVISLEWDPAKKSTDVETFRQQILLPVLKTVDQRRLSGHIDYVVYSTGFPTAIDAKADVDRYLESLRSARDAGKAADQAGEKSGGEPPAAEPKWPKHLPPTASLTGLTYLWQPVVLRNAGYMDLMANQYMRREGPDSKEQPTMGFHSHYNFGLKGELLERPGRRYLLSTMLGVIDKQGNTVEEILNYLRRGAGADGTHPRGTIYFVENGDIRSKVRHHMFPDVVRQLRSLGVEAAIEEGTMPLGKSDVQGVVMGTASFNWGASKSTILPGAICDHFTSFGGVMHGGGQTTLAEFLRYGAAGSCGTVTEPYAILQKFPVPTIQVHYARGCSLAEAFYQSVFGPYQLLIVGDPLCQPWANVPTVSVEGVEAGATVKGTLTLRPKAEFPGSSRPDHFELFVDDLRRGRCQPGETLVLDTAQLADGYHELRVVAIEAGPIGAQGRQVIPVTTANHGQTIEASVAPAGSVKADTPLVVKASAPGSMGILVLYNSHLVGRINGQSGSVEIDPKKLGLGPVSLRVVSMGKGDPLTYAWAPPLAVTIEEG